ncbi:hypothetical protein PROFUN_14150 [Planoprotostelium fungivorum]|uniref:Axonemal dynein light intermediate polypeptide 1 n=1 Tax=Planoprotostelium fungivorum TaxID=1890364 RepID=A0A2P6N1L7_9EUKA|nr:hypothetical protein PROFUN_14150 [Planoprotostelium fungivorum]
MSQQAKESLIKYESAILVSEKNDKTIEKKATKRPHNKLPPVVAEPSKANQVIEEILNAIIPPKEWTEDGKLWMQKVSSTPATRLEVIALQESLDQKLQVRKARETGICPVRQDLYAQTFDELIRQVTINCAERGLLLLRVRDEIRMTTTAYQTLYESAIAWGMRKALESEQGKADMEKKIEVLEEDKKDLERQLQELKSKCEFIEKRENERRAHEEKKHAEEVAFLKRTNQQIKAQLESILKKN